MANDFKIGGTGTKTPKHSSDKPSSDPSKANTRENLDTTFGRPNEDK